MISMIVLLYPSTANAYTFRQNNCRTGYVSAGVGLPLKRQFVIDLKAPIVSSPVAVNDTLYIGARDSCIRAFFGTNVLWEHHTGGWVDATPTYMRGHVYAGSRDGMTYDLDARTGDSLGMYPSTNQMSSPLVTDSIIAFGRGGGNSHLMAYGVRSRGYLWHVVNDQMVYSSPAINDSVLVYGDDGGGLFAVDAFTGKRLWKYATDGGVYLSSPAIDGNRVFFSPGDYDKCVYALNLADGSLLWKSAPQIEAGAVPLPKRLIWMVAAGSPEHRAQTLTALGKAGAIAPSNASALRDVAAGKSAAFVPLGGNATSSAAVGDSAVYVVHMEYGYPKNRFSITAFDIATGVEAWSFSDVRSCELLGFCSSPLVSDSVVFVGWGEGKVYALDAWTGAVLWQDSLDGDIMASPTAENGKLYVATYSGKIAVYSRGADVPGDFVNGTYCYPNPARGRTAHIQVRAGNAGAMTLTLYTLQEKPVITKSRQMTAGELYIYDWDLKSVANGAYIAKVTMKYAGGKTDMKFIKIAVLR